MPRHHPPRRHSKETRQDKTSAGLQHKAPEPNLKEYTRLACYHTVCGGLVAFDSQTREWSCNNHHMFSLKIGLCRGRFRQQPFIVQKPRAKTSMERNYTPCGKFSWILMSKRMNFFVQTLGFLGLLHPGGKVKRTDLLVFVFNSNKNPETPSRF